MSRNPLSQLASIGEDVLEKASQNPTANRVLKGAAQMKDRVDDLSKRVRGLEAMEKRVTGLEARLAKLEGGAKKAATSAKKSATKR